MLVAIRSSASSLAYSSRVPPALFGSIRTMYRWSPWVSRGSRKSGSRSHGCPARWTGTIAFVRSVTAAAACSESMLRSESRTSTNTGLAPVWTITFAVAGQVIGVVITSSPGPTSRATSARCIAAVPDETASACFAPTYAANRRSSSAAFSPVVSQPDRIVRATASISSSPTAGGWKESIVSRLLESMGRPEAYESGGRPGPVECLVPARPDRLNGADAIRATPELLDDEPRTAVGADAEHTRRNLRVFEPLDRLELAGIGGQEDGRRTTGSGLPDERHRFDPPPPRPRGGGGGLGDP